MFIEPTRSFLLTLHVGTIRRAPTSPWASPPRVPRSPLGPTQLDATVFADVHPCGATVDVMVTPRPPRTGQDPVFAATALNAQAVRPAKDTVRRGCGSTREVFARSAVNQRELTEKFQRIREQPAPGRRSERRRRCVSSASDAHTVPTPSSTPYSGAMADASLDPRVPPRARDFSGDSRRAGTLPRPLTVPIAGYRPFRDARYTGLAATMPLFNDIR